MPAGVPTIWMGVLPELARAATPPRCGPSRAAARPCPRALSKAYREQTGLPLLQAWGMTETSPICTVGWITSALRADDTEDELDDVRAMQGLPLVGVDIRVVTPDTTDELPWDGESSGELQAKGPWIARSYYDDPRAARELHRRRLAAHRRRGHHRARRATCGWWTGPRT